MKAKNLMILAMVLALAIVPMSYAVSTGASVGVGAGVSPGNSAPVIYQNTAQRKLMDILGNPLTRVNNYAFTGESITWKVFVRDANGREDIKSVTGTAGSSAVQGGNPDEVGCVRDLVQPADGYGVTWANGGMTYNQNTDYMYTCQLTVEPGYSLENYAQVVVVDQAGSKGSVKEDSFFYFNPSIALEILNAPTGVVFPAIAPGATGYSQTISVKNKAADNSGVILKMSIAGKDFYDSTNSAAKCPTSNVLKLSNFRYFATKGSYSSQTNGGVDAEGYDTIPYTTAPALIIDANSELNQGAEMSLTFKLNFPSPCYGNYNSGTFEFTGEAI